MQAKAMGRLFRLKAKAAGAESDFALCRRAENPQDFLLTLRFVFLFIICFLRSIFGLFFRRFRLFLTLRLMRWARVHLLRTAQSLFFKRCQIITSKGWVLILLWGFVKCGSLLKVWGNYGLAHCLG